MIIFELACRADHRFEGWFASAEAYQAEEVGGRLECPVCGSHEVVKIPHAKISVRDVVASSGNDAVPSAAPPAPPTPQARFQAVAALVQRLIAETEDVGPAFPEEARRIHYDEAPSRAIRGVASIEETRELLDEGIGVLPLPIPTKKDWN